MVLAKTDSRGVLAQADQSSTALRTTLETNIQHSPANTCEIMTSRRYGKTLVKNAPYI
jgi:hypothetical protein